MPGICQLHDPEDAFSTRDLACYSPKCKEDCAEQAVHA